MKVTIQTPKSLWLNEYYSLDFEARSKLQGTSERVSMSMTYWVWGMYVPTFDPLFVLIAAAVMAVGLRGRLKHKDEEDVEWM